MPSLAALNQLKPSEAEAALLKCCGSRAWASRMCQARPFRDKQALFEAADRIWNELGKENWLEAFSHHPRIGERQLREKFASTSAWAHQEQKGTKGASEQTLQALARGNQDYEKRFGHVFLICATGKSADEMLAALEARIENVPATELRIAAGEQAKITRIRLEKLLNESGPRP